MLLCLLALMSGGMALMTGIILAGIMMFDMLVLDI